MMVLRRLGCLELRLDFDRGRHNARWEGEREFRKRKATHLQMSTRIAVLKIIQLSISNRKTSSINYTPCHSSLDCAIDSGYLPFVNYNTSNHICIVGDLHESLLPCTYLLWRESIRLASRQGLYGRTHGGTSVTSCILMYWSHKFIPCLCEMWTIACVR